MVLFLSISIGTFSQEITEFRGNGRQGIFEETNLLKSWPEQGPELLLSVDSCGKGHSSPIFHKNNIYVTGIKHDSIDVCTAFDMDGNLLWETKYGRAWFRTYPDTRSTPTIENDIIYLVGGMGVVVAINTLDGEKIWEVDAHKKYHGTFHKFGIAESTLLTDKGVTYITGGDSTTIVALDKKDGSLLWKTKSIGGERSYASSILVDWKGEELMIAQTAKSLLGINPSNGDIYWEYDLIQYHTFRQGKGNQSNNPIFLDGFFFITSGYNHPGLMFSIEEGIDKVNLVWRNDTLDTHHGGGVLVDGNIYGSNWLANSKGNWVSLDWETGKVNWETKWINKGSIVAADGMLYLFEEKTGNLALVKPSPEELKIVGSFKFEGGTGPFWAHPYIAEGKLFVRHGDVMNVYNIKAK